MTWTKLGDEFADECWTLTDAAFRLHTEALIWSNRKATDGQLAKPDMVRWARHPEAADELVAVGWWKDCGSHYKIVHHIGYQRTAKQVAHQSIVNRNNRAKGKTRPIRTKNDPSDGSSDESSDERDRTGQDRPGQRNRGTLLSNGQHKRNDSGSDQEYAASLREWYEKEP
jgi:hypothetical protein